MNYYLRTVSFVAFEGENEGKGEGEGEDTKTFTQDEVNTIMATEKRKTQEAQKKLATQLQEGSTD